MTKATDSPKDTGDVEITPEMVEAGVRAYEAWEDDNTPAGDFRDVWGGAGSYAKRDLVEAILRESMSVSSTHPR